MEANEGTCHGGASPLLIAAQSGATQRALPSRASSAFELSLSRSNERSPRLSSERHSLLLCFHAPKVDCPTRLTQSHFDAIEGLPASGLAGWLISFDSLEPCLAWLLSSLARQLAPHLLRSCLPRLHLSQARKL